jgi:hypothetical protein
MIAAILSICLQADPAQCALQHFRIEPNACHLPSYRAEVPAGGAWRAVMVRVKCLAQTVPQRRHS